MSDPNHESANEPPDTDVEIGFGVGPGRDLDGFAKIHAVIGSPADNPAGDVTLCGRNGPLQVFVGLGPDTVDSVDCPECRKRLEGLLLGKKILSDPPYVSILVSVWGVSGFISSFIVEQGTALFFAAVFSGLAMLWAREVHRESIA